MNNGKVESTVINGDIYVRFEDLLENLYLTVKNAQKIASDNPADFNSPEYNNQIMGMMTLCLGLEEAHQRMRVSAGLTRQTDVL